MRHGRPLALMPSVRTGPDQKHALEALWRKWVFPLPVSTDGTLHRDCPSQTLPGPLPKSLCIAPRYRSPVTIIAQIILAILLASATAAILGVRRANRCINQGRQTLFEELGHNPNK